MGWLKDIARRRGRSLPKIAGAILKKVEMESPPKETHVANMLRKADAEDTAWFLGIGLPFVPAMAQQLGMREDVLLAMLEDHDEGHRTRVRIPGLPGLPPIEVKDGTLPPGLAGLVGTVGLSALLNRRHWCQVPGALSTKLLSRWMGANWGCDELQFDTWADVPAVLGSNAVIRLGSTEGFEDVEEGHGGDAFLLVVLASAPRPPTRRELEVQFAGGGDSGSTQDGLAALSFDDEPGLEAGNGERKKDTGGKEPERSAGTDRDDAGDREDEARGSGEDQSKDRTPSPWQEHAMPRVEAYAGDLVKWVFERTQGVSETTLHSAQGLTKRSHLTEWCSTFEDVIELLSVVIAGAPEEPNGLLRRYLERNAIAHGGSGTAEASKRDSDILLALAVRRLRARRTGPLTRDEWEALVPDDVLGRQTVANLRELLLQPDPDVESLREIALQSTDSPVEEYLRRGLLRPDEGGLELGPKWIRELVEELALGSLMESDVHGMGAALLNHAYVERVLEAWIQTVQGGDLAEVTTVISEADTDVLEDVVAIDGAFRACGIALLRGARIDAEVVRGMWDRQMDLVERMWDAHPRVPLLGIAQQAKGEGLTTWAGWWLAALVISRELARQGESLPPNALSPWQAQLDEADLEELRQMLDQIGLALGGFKQPVSLDEEHDDLAAARELAGAIIAVQGPLPGPGGIGVALSTLVGPYLLTAWSLGRLELDEETELLSLPFGLHALEEVAVREGTTLRDVLAFCWTKWELSRHHPALGRVTPNQARDGESEIWAALAPDHAGDAVCKVIGRRHFAWPHVRLETWMRWVEWFVAKDRRVDPQLFENLPWPALERLLDLGGLGPWMRVAVPRVWARYPAQLLELVDRHATAAPVHSAMDPTRALPLWELISSADRDSSLALVERAARWAHDPAAYPGLGDAKRLKRYLAMTVHRRRPGWEKAWEPLRRLREM